MLRGISLSSNRLSPSPLAVTLSTNTSSLVSATSLVLWTSVDNRSHDPASPKKWGHLTLKPPTIDDYIGTPVEHSKRMIIWLTDRQPTHPQKVGAMIWEVSLFLLLTCLLFLLSSSSLRRCGASVLSSRFDS